MDTVQINITTTPNVVTANITEAVIEVTINVTEGGGGMECADLAACQTIIDLQNKNLQQVIINGNKVSGRVVESDDGLTFMFISDSAINLQNNFGSWYGIVNAANGSVTIMSGDGTVSEYSIISITKDAIQLQVTDTFITSNINQTKNGIDLVGNSVSKNGYELATESFVDNRVQSNIKIIGDWDATSGSYPLADESNTTPFITQWGATIKAGWAFRVGYGQAGTVDGFDYENGDVVYALVDSPTDNASDWGDLDHNLQQANESLRGTAKIVTAAIITDETSTDDKRIVTTKKLWLNFWTRVLAIAHTFAAKITFTSAPRFNSASASQYLKVDANKDLESTSSIPMSDINVTITDYASTSTITGFSSFTTKIIQVIDMNAYDLINFDLAGTSNATTLAFTIPNSLSSSAPSVSAIIHSLSGATNGSGLAQIAISSSTVNCFFNVSSATWSGSGPKRVRGTIFVQK